MELKGGFSAVIAIGESPIISLILRGFSGLRFQMQAIKGVQTNCG
jgi:hypothetical protein